MVRTGGLREHPDPADSYGFDSSGHALRDELRRSLDADRPEHGRAGRTYRGRKVSFGSRGDADGKTAYNVANGATASSVTPVNLATRKTGKPITVGRGAHSVAITPDGKMAYVLSLTADGVTPIDIRSNAARGAIAVDQPGGIAITPNGTTAYVTSGPDGTVIPIDTRTNIAGAPIPVGPYPSQIAITPNGATAYVIVENPTGIGRVVSIDTATNSTRPAITVEHRPAGIAITPDGKTAYVTNWDDESVSPINLTTQRVGTPIPLKVDPVSIVITPDGTTAYVTNNVSRTTRLSHRSIFRREPLEQRSASANTLAASPSRPDTIRSPDAATTSQPPTVVCSRSVRHASTGRPEASHSIAR